MSSTATIEEAKEASVIYDESTGIRKITVNGSTWKLPRNFHVSAEYLPKKNLDANSGEVVILGSEQGVFRKLKMYTGQNPPEE
jgi:hypothetical protein